MVPATMAFVPVTMATLDSAVTHVSVYCTWLGIIGLTGFGLGLAESASHSSITFSRTCSSHTCHHRLHNKVSGGIQMNFVYFICLNCYIEQFYRKLG